MSAGPEDPLPAVWQQLGLTGRRARTATPGAAPGTVMLTAQGAGEHR